MNATRMFGRALALAGLLVLAACQTTGQKTASVPEPARARTNAATPSETTQPAQQQGAPVAVYVADTAQHKGWTPVSIQSGTLYVNPTPVLTRADLSSVQAGAGKQGEGLLAL